MRYDRAEKALFLIQEGYSAKEIVEMLGYSSTSCVYNLAKKHNLKLAKAHAAQHEAMRRYKAEGHTMGEVAEKFGVCKGTAQLICKGIAPQESRPPKDGYHPKNKGTFQDIENVKRIISERADGFEYAGNYTGSSGRVDLRCKKCGYVHTHSWCNLRHKGVTVCPNCVQIQKQERETEELKRREEQRLNAERKRRGEAAIRLLTRAKKLHRCPVCGTITDKKLYCSTKCYQKAYEATKDARRRKRIQGALVDKDISLERLYNRDNGVCAICGDKCDWDDYKYRGHYFIAGSRYPSIDHIVPLSKGGEHSWRNVQLAHFSCNSAKGARVVG